MPLDTAYASPYVHRTARRSLADRSESRPETDLPLPLGGNVIRKDLGPELMRRISRLLVESIRYGLAHREEALAHAMQFGRGLDAPSADRFVGMYVNDWTLDYGPRGKEAVRLFLRRGHAAGILPRPVEPTFVA